MKKLLGIVVLGLLLSNKSYSDQWDFSKIEHFKCYYDKTTAAYIDHQGTKELKLKEPQIFEEKLDDITENLEDKPLNLNEEEPLILKNEIGHVPH